MLVRALSFSPLLARIAAMLTLAAGAGTIHREPFSRRPRPTLGAAPAAPLPQASLVDMSIAAIGVGTTIMKDDCLTVAAGAGAAYECGDLRLVHELPSTTTMARRRTPTLIYNSRHENGITLFPVDVYMWPSGVLGITAKVVLTTPAGVLQAQSPAISWGGWAPPMTRRIAVPVNTSALATGVYGYRVIVDFNMADGTMIEKSASSTVAIVNRSQSPFGKGWWLDGLEQIVAYDNTHKLWVGGDGSTRVYTKSSTSSSIWTVTPTIDRPDTLQQVSTSVWRRHLRNGAYVQFDNTGRHTQTVDRSGHVTVFAYENASRPTVLTTIKLPLPPQSPRATNPPSYRFTYSSTRLSSVEAPPIGTQVRRTTIADGGTPSTYIITDPDGRRISFNGTPGVGVTSRWDQRGFGTTYVYHAASYTLSSATLGMQGTAPEDITTYYTAAERAGVAGSVAMDTALAVTMLSGPRFIFPLVTRVGVNRFGAVRWTRTILGEQTTLRREDTRFPALVTGLVRPNGFTTVATYNARGLVVAVTDSQPWVGLTTISPTTRYRWSTGKFDVMSSVVHPEGDSIAFGYFSNGDRQWEQVGGSQVRRVQYRYSSSRQLSAVTSPGNNPLTEVDSVEYDRTLGNVSRTLTPRRIATRYHSDAIGRVDSVFSPGASNTLRTTVTTYDLMDRPVTQTDIGPRNNYTLGASFLPLAVRDSATARTAHVQHYYDAVGNDTLVERWATPNPTNIPLRQIYTRFDGANRKVWELSASGGVRQWSYDVAGNVIAAITPRRDTIRMEYDVLNRLTRKITPAVRYEPVNMSDGPTALYSARFPNFAEGYSHDWHVRNDPMPPPLIIPGDTTTFEYDVNGAVTAATNHDALVSRTYYPNGSRQLDGQYLRGFDPSASSPYTHSFVSQRVPNTNGQLGTRYIVRAGNCETWYCTQGFGYSQDTGELTSINDDGVVVRFDRRPELRTVNVNVTDPSGYTRIDQWVRRDADGRAVARSAGPAGAPLFVDTLGYDDANRVIASATDYPADAQRSTRAENAYSSLGALAGAIRQRGGVSVSDKYQTDAFANVMAHTARNLTDNRGAVVNTYGYSNADQQLSADMSATDWQPDRPPVDVIEQTFATTFDAAGNRIFFRKALQKYDRGRREYVSANYGLEWNWNAYDAEDRLRVSQRSYFADSVTLRTVFIEYSYDPLGRRVQTRTRWDMHCPPGPRGECHPSVERTIWDGDEIVQELRSGYYDIVPEDNSPPHTCEEGWDVASHPWCAPDYVPPPVPVRYVQGELDLEWTGGPFEGIVRYINGEGIDEPIVVNKSNLGTFVPLRSARGLVEDGLFLGGATSGVSWPARDIDHYGARDILTAVPIEPTHWLGSVIGDRRDAAGLVYMRNRYYDPSAGRFTQEDPIGLAGGMNLYGFAGGDPVNFSDPFGLCPDPRGADFCPGRQGLKSAGLLDPIMWLTGGIAAGIERGFAAMGADAATSAGAPVAANKVAGDAFRDEIASAFENNGYGVAKEVGKKTPFGRRVIDLEVSKNGDVLGGIEAKAGKSRYLPWQRAKDEYLQRGGYPVQVVRDATAVKASVIPPQ